jgi:hypothetical protein
MRNPPQHDRLKLRISESIAGRSIVRLPSSGLWVNPKDQLARQAPSHEPLPDQPHEVVIIAASVDERQIFEHDVGTLDPVAWVPQLEPSSTPKLVSWYKPSATASNWIDRSCR